MKSSLRLFPMKFTLTIVSTCIMEYIERAIAVRLQPAELHAL